jgi:gluconokinase
VSVSLPVVLVIMGVSGSGKSTVGMLLAQRLGWPFEEGDSLHPAANVAKMAAGHPLTDEDRWPWLDRIGAKLAQGERTVVACSALRRAYRDRLRAAAGPKLRFVYLEATPEEMRARVAGRVGHYMPASLVDSQFAALEPPRDEPDVITISAHADLDEEIPRLAERLREDAHDPGIVPRVGGAPGAAL